MVIDSGEAPSFDIAKKKPKAAKKAETSARKVDERNITRAIENGEVMTTNADAAVANLLTSSACPVETK